MLGTALKARHLKRYKEIVWLFMKYGRSDIVTLGGEPPGRGDDLPAPADLAADLERLGPTYVKLGQLLSTRAEMLPAGFAESLSRLQDRVEPFPFPDARRIVESELGARLDELFLRFDPKPVAAASLSQIHEAVLPDGRKVAVKVQRPGLRARVTEDLQAILETAAFLDKHTRAGRNYEFERLLQEFKEGLFRELNFEHEAESLRRMAADLAEFPRLRVPRPVADRSTSRVLTMDFIEGSKIAEVPGDADGPGLADELFRAYLKQLLVTGFFHADPHPGNVLLTPGRRLGLIDLGMTARLTPEFEEKLLLLLLDICDGRGEDAAAQAMDLGQRRREFDETRFERRVAALVLRHKDSPLARIDVGRAVLDIVNAAADSGLRPPPELAMVGKTLLNLDLVVRSLDPEFNPTEVLRREATSLVSSRLRASMSRAGVYSELLELKRLAFKLPSRLDRIFEKLSRDELRVRIDAMDQESLFEALQKIANRVALGAILGSLIIGAALLMRVDTPFKLFGYPGLAIILFGAAAGCGMSLVASIWKSDRKGGPRDA
jgi:ubiquinone biosynthesis protein